MLQCGHLFNGIGGFALAAHWMGWTNVFHCEIDDFCNKVMNKHFPESIQYGDIKEQDFTGYRGTIDVLTGGFPCQPYSTAGKRMGKEDDRHLWPEMLRAIREIQPRWVVGENVRGLTNWNGGLVFDEVQADLEAEGYEVLPFLLPACAVNAPHRRDRIWFIAHARCKSCDGGQGFKYGESEYYRENERRQEEADQLERLSKAGINSNSSGQGLQVGVSGEFQCIQHQAGTQQGSKSARTFAAGDWWEFPTQSPVCNRNDGIPDRLVGISFSKWRTEGIRAMGNAIVPQVGLQLFKAIQEYDH